MSVVYIYVLDTLADWEIGHVISELNSGRFFKKGADQVSLKYVACSKQSITTMGGLTIVPDCEIDDIVMNETSILLLPGADTWNDSKHTAIIEKAKQLLNIGATVCANVELLRHLPKQEYLTTDLIQVMEPAFLICLYLNIVEKAIIRIVYQLQMKTLLLQDVQELFFGQSRFLNE